LSFGTPNIRSSTAPAFYPGGPSAQSFYSGGSQAILEARTFDLEPTFSGSAGAEGFETVGLDKDDMNAIEYSELAITFDDGLTVESFAEALLTGMTPQSNLLPQKGAQVAPLATFLSDDPFDKPLAVSTDEDAGLHDLLIDPAVKFPVDFVLLTPPARIPPKTLIRDLEPSGGNEPISSLDNSQNLLRPAKWLSLALALGVMISVIGWHRAKPAAVPDESPEVPR
jgi:hypothetical protein